MSWYVYYRYKGKGWRHVMSSDCSRKKMEKMAKDCYGCYGGALGYKVTNRKPTRKTDPAAFKKHRTLTFYWYCENCRRKGEVKI